MRRQPAEHGGIQRVRVDEDRACLGVVLGPQPADGCAGPVLHQQAAAVPVVAGDDEVRGGLLEGGVGTAENGDVAGRDQGEDGVGVGGARRAGGQAGQVRIDHRWSLPGAVVADNLVCGGGCRAPGRVRLDGGMTQQSGEDQSQQQIVVVGPDGRPIGIVAGPPGGVPAGGPGGSGGAGGSSDGHDDLDEGSLASMVEQPAKVMRIGSMIKQLLEEVRGSSLDEAGRARLRDIHERSIKELEAGLAPELVDELERLSLPFDQNTVPSEAELRIAQAQLVGWLEGLFHGIQTALFAQQMAARAQLEQIRRQALPPGGGLSGRGPDADEDASQRSSGPYL